LRLIRSENVGPVAFRQLINHFGGAENALAALPDLSRRGGARRPIRLCSKDDAEEELEAAARAGALPVFTIEPNYPALLARIDAPPPMLYIKGRHDLLNRPAVAIVGSRQCSAAGVQLTRQFASTLAGAGFVIVSGLARGIDRAAHETALAGGTVAVVAGGIDWIYPPEHAELQGRIGRDGCLVSERPPGFKPRDKDFPRRNRIIAGLVHGVVIIEAATRSGTLITARYANELGREVFALPGHPLDPRAEGTNRLIKSGATFVTTPEDVIDMLRPIIGLAEARAEYTSLVSDGTSLDALGAPGGASPGETASEKSNHPQPSQPQASPVGDSGDHMNAVVTALGPAPIAVDAIARATGLSVQSVQVALLELDLAGRLERQGLSLVALRSN
jgi:DNA processing protein